MLSHKWARRVRVRTPSGSDYGPGDIGGCVGWQWSGRWKDAGAKR